MYTALSPSKLDEEAIVTFNNVLLFGTDTHISAHRDFSAAAEKLKLIDPVAKGLSHPEIVKMYYDNIMAIICARDMLPEEYKVKSLSEFYEKSMGYATDAYEYFVSASCEISEETQLQLRIDNMQQTGKAFRIAARATPVPPETLLDEYYTRIENMSPRSTVSASAFIPVRYNPTQDAKEVLSAFYANNEEHYSTYAFQATQALGVMLLTSLPSEDQKVGMFFEARDFFGLDPDLRTAEEIALAMKYVAIRAYKRAVGTKKESAVYDQYKIAFDENKDLFEEKSFKAFYDAYADVDNTVPIWPKAEQEAKYGHDRRAKRSGTRLKKFSPKGVKLSVCDYINVIENGRELSGPGGVASKAGKLAEAMTLILEVIANGHVYFYKNYLRAVAQYAGARARTRYTKAQYYCTLKNYYIATLREMESGNFPNKDIAARVIAQAKAQMAELYGKNYYRNLLEGKDVACVSEYSENLYYDAPFKHPESRTYDIGPKPKRVRSPKTSRKRKSPARRKKRSPKRKKKQPVVCAEPAAEEKEECDYNVTAAKALCKQEEKQEDTCEMPEVDEAVFFAFFADLDKKYNFTDTARLKRIVADKCEGESKLQHFVRTQYYYYYYLLKAEEAGIVDIYINFLRSNIVGSTFVSNTFFEKTWNCAQVEDLFKLVHSLIPEDEDENETRKLVTIAKDMIVKMSQCEECESICTKTADLLAFVRKTPEPAEKEPVVVEAKEPSVAARSPTRSPAACTPIKNKDSDEICVKDAEEPVQLTLEKKAFVCVLEEKKSSEDGAKYIETLLDAIVNMKFWLYYEDIPKTAESEDMINKAYAAYTTTLNHPEVATLIQSLSACEDNSVVPKRNVKAEEEEFADLTVRTTDEGKFTLFAKSVKLGDVDVNTLSKSFLAKWEGIIRESYEGEDTYFLDIWIYRTITGAFPYWASAKWVERTQDEENVQKYVKTPDVSTAKELFGLISNFETAWQLEAWTEEARRIFLAANKPPNEWFISEGFKVKPNWDRRTYDSLVLYPEIISKDVTAKVGLNEAVFFAEDYLVNIPRAEDESKASSSLPKWAKQAKVIYLELLEISDSARDILDIFPSIATMYESVGLPDFAKESRNGKLANTNYILQLLKFILGMEAEPALSTLETGNNKYAVIDRLNESKIYKDIVALTEDSFEKVPEFGIFAVPSMRDRVLARKQDLRKLFSSGNFTPTTLALNKAQLNVVWERFNKPNLDTAFSAYIARKMRTVAGYDFTKDSSIMLATPPELARPRLFVGGNQRKAFETLTALRFDSDSGKFFTYYANALNLGIFAARPNVTTVETWSALTRRRSKMASAFGLDKTLYDTEVYMRIKDASHEIIKPTLGSIAFGKMLFDIVKTGNMSKVQPQTLDLSEEADVLVLEAITDLEKGKVPDVLPFEYMGELGLVYFKPKIISELRKSFGLKTRECDKEYATAILKQILSTGTYSSPEIKSSECDFLAESLVANLRIMDTHALENSESLKKLLKIAEYKSVREAADDVSFAENFKISPYQKRANTSLATLLKFGVSANDTMSSREASRAAFKDIVYDGEMLDKYQNSPVSLSETYRLLSALFEDDDYVKPSPKSKTFVTNMLSKESYSLGYLSGTSVFATSLRDTEDDETYNLGISIAQYITKTTRVMPRALKFANIYIGSNVVREWLKAVRSQKGILYTAYGDLKIMRELAERVPKDTTDPMFNIIVPSEALPGTQEVRRFTLFALKDRFEQTVYDMIKPLLIEGVIYDREEFDKRMPKLEVPQSLFDALYDIYFNGLCAMSAGMSANFTAEIMNLYKLAKISPEDVPKSITLSKDGELYDCMDTTIGEFYEKLYALPEEDFNNIDVVSELLNKQGFTKLHPYFACYKPGEKYLCNNVFDKNATNVQEKVYQRFFHDIEYRRIVTKGSEISDTKIIYNMAFWEEDPSDEVNALTTDEMKDLYDSVRNYFRGPLPNLDKAPGEPNWEEIGIVSAEAVPSIELLEKDGKKWSLYGNAILLRRIAQEVDSDKIENITLAIVAQSQVPKYNEVFYDWVTQTLTDYYLTSTVSNNPENTVLDYHALLSLGISMKRLPCSEDAAEIAKDILQDATT